MTKTVDRARKPGPKNRIKTKPKTGRAERDYARALKSVGHHVGAIVRQFAPEKPEDVPALADVLRKYAEALNAWAIVTARKMLEEVDSRDWQAWVERSAGMSAALRQELRTTRTGQILQERRDEQVRLIKSIPMDA